jgi:hypothetical protein
MQPVYFKSSLTRRMLIPGLYLIMLGLPFINFLFLTGELPWVPLSVIIIYSIITAAWSCYSEWKIDAGKLYHRKNRFSWEEITKEEIETIEYTPGWGIRPVWILKGIKEGKLFKYKIKADITHWNPAFIQELYQYRGLTIPAEVESILEDKWEAGKPWRKFSGYLWLLIALLNGILFFRLYPMGMDIPEWFHFAFLFLASIIPLTLVTCLFIPEKQINKSLFGLIALLFTPLYFVLIQHPTSWDDNYTFFIWGSLMAFSLGMAALFLFKKAQEKYSAVILGSLAAALIFWLTPLNLIPHPQFQKIQIPEGYFSVCSDLGKEKVVASIRKGKNNPQLLVWDIPEAKAELLDFPSLPLKQFINWKNSISPDDKTILSILKDTDNTHSSLVYINLGNTGQPLKTKIFPGVGGNRVSWSPSNKWTAHYESTFSRTNQNLWLLNMETLELAKPVPFNNCSIKQLSWESDTALYCLTGIYADLRPFDKKHHKWNGYSLWKLVLDTAHPEKGFIPQKLDILPDSAIQAYLYPSASILSYTQDSEMIYHFVRLDTKAEIKLPGDPESVTPNLVDFNQEGTRYLHVEFASQPAKKQLKNIFAFNKQIPFKIIETELASGKSTVLFSGKQDIHNLSYTADGNRLYFVDTKNLPFKMMIGLYVIDRDTKQYWKVLPQRYPFPVNYEETFMEDIGSAGHYCLLKQNPFNDRGWLGQNALTVAIMPDTKGN